MRTRIAALAGVVLLGSPILLALPAASAHPLTIAVDDDAKGSDKKDDKKDGETKKDEDRPKVKATDVRKNFSQHDPKTPTREQVENIKWDIDGENTTKAKKGVSKVVETPKEIMQDIFGKGWRFNNGNLFEDRVLGSEKVANYSYKDGKLKIDFFKPERKDRVYTLMRFKAQGTFNEETFLIFVDEATTGDEPADVFVMEQGKFFGM